MSDSLVTLSLKQMDMFISAYPQQIVFGIFKNNAYQTNQHFIIPFFQVHFWYLAILDIVGAFAKESLITKNLILSFEEHIHYSWILLDSGNLSFVIEVNGDVTFRTHFTILQFNNLILTFKDLLFYTLCLKSYELDTFHKIACLSLDQILSLKNKNVLKELLKSLLNDETHLANCEIVVSYYLEIIVIKHKFDTLFNPDESLTDKILEMIVK